MPERRRRGRKTLYTVKECAEVIGISEGAVRWNILQGYLPATKNDEGYHEWLVEASALRAFQEEYYR